MIIDHTAVMSCGNQLIQNAQFSEVARSFLAHESRRTYNAPRLVPGVIGEH